MVSDRGSLGGTFRGEEGEKPITPAAAELAERAQQRKGRDEAVEAALQRAQAELTTPRGEEVPSVFRQFQSVH